MLEQIIFTLSNFNLALDYVQETYPVLMFLIYFSFAASLGSFLGCCYYRIPRGISLINPKNSYCPTCKNKLKVLDLVPILSYIFLRAKCRHCKTKIAPTYFIIECLTVIAVLAVIYT